VFGHFAVIDHLAHPQSDLVFASHKGAERGRRPLRSALLEVLDALRNADAGDRIKQAAETIYQALIDAELTALIGAGPHWSPRC
jgi:hypothetical protein